MPGRCGRCAGCVRLRCSPMERCWPRLLLTAATISSTSSRDWPSQSSRSWLHAGYAAGCLRDCRPLPGAQNMPRRQSRLNEVAMARRPGGTWRKLVQFDEETWLALDLLRRDQMKSFDELASEAFRDLL